MDFSAIAFPCPDIVGTECYCFPLDIHSQIVDYWLQNKGGHREARYQQE
jgi:hypothetical protein